MKALDIVFREEVFWSLFEFVKSNHQMNVLLHYGVINMTAKEGITDPRTICPDCNGHGYEMRGPEPEYCEACDHTGIRPRAAT